MIAFEYEGEKYEVEKVGNGMVFLPSGVLVKIQQPLCIGLNPNFQAKRVNVQQAKKVE